MNRPTRYTTTRPGYYVGSSFHGVADHLMLDFEQRHDGLDVGAGGLAEATSEGRLLLAWAIRVARAALDKGLDSVSAGMHQEQTAAETALPEVQADRREGTRLYLTTRDSVD